MKSERTTGTPSGYLLDNAELPATRRLSALTRTYDAGTFRHLAARGVTSGWSCLEVGAGSGTVAAWLSQAVGATGRVLVTDIDPRHLSSLERPNLSVACHDIVRDPLPEASFDLIHARLVLLHLPEREAVLRRLSRALKPGGWLVDEELDYSVLPDPALAPGETLLPTHRAMLQVMDRHGIDRNWGRKLFGQLRAIGLGNVGAEGRTFMWPAGSSGLEIILSNYEQLQRELIAAGTITREQWEEDHARLKSPDYVMPSPVLWAAWGQRQ